MTSARAALDRDSIRVLVNGDPVRFESIGPREIDGRMMVPLRGVLEQTGADVHWMSATQTVSATKNDMSLELTIGSRTAHVNGRNVQLDVPAMTIAGSTMVPLRFVTESLGGEVNWDARTRTVSITTSDQLSGNPNDRNGRYNPRQPNDRGDGFAHRSEKPRVDSISHSMSNNMLGAGENFHITVRGTPGGQAWFRIRGAVGESKLRETDSGVYEGTWRNNNDHDVRVQQRDILAFIVVRNVSSPETTPDGINQR